MRLIPWSHTMVIVIASLGAGWVLAGAWCRRHVALDGRVRTAAWLAIAQLIFLLVSNAEFAVLAVRRDVWRIEPLLVRLAVIQAVFLLPASLLFLRAVTGLLEHRPGAGARARNTAAMMIAIRGMRVVAAVAVASELSRGMVAWMQIARAMPGVAAVIVEAAVLLRAAHRVEAVEPTVEEPMD